MKKLLLIVSALLFITGCEVENANNHIPENKPVTYQDGLLIDGVILEKTGFVLVTDKDVTVEGNSESGAFKKRATVTIKPFYIGKYEVTQELYEKITGYNPSNFKIASEGEKSKLLPVESITWYDAIYFCKLMNDKLFLESPYEIEVLKRDESNRIIEAKVLEKEYITNGFRLPSQAEWEFAARGGNPLIENWDYSLSGLDIDTSESNWLKNEIIAQYCWKGCDTTHEVGLLKSNNLEIYDMSGNVWEWCFDIIKTDWKNNKKIVYRASRGGSILNSAYLEVYKAGFTDDRTESSLWFDLGFRLCRSYIPEN